MTNRRELSGCVLDGQLTDDDREEISRGIAQRAEGKVIAGRIGRCPSVVSRDIDRHGGRAGYRATVAARGAARSRRRPKTRKLDGDPVLRERVMGKLRAGCSPDQAAGRLRHEHGGDPAVRVAATVSREAIYTWIYALPKGELAARGILLRSGARPGARGVAVQPGGADRGYDQHRRPPRGGHRPSRTRPLGR